MSTGRFHEEDAKEFFEAFVQFFGIGMGIMNPAHLPSYAFHCPFFRYSISHKLLIDGLLVDGAP